MFLLPVSTTPLFGYSTSAVMEDHFLFYCVSIWWREDWIPSSASWDQVTRPGSVAAFYFLATAASWLNAGIDGRTAGKQELALLWHVCPKFTCWNSNAGCDGIRRQGLWEVTSVIWGHRSEALMNKCLPLWESWESLLLLSALCHVRIQRELSSLEP